MQKFYFPLFFFLGLTVTAAAQTGGEKNADPNAPVNVSDPSLRPAQPAQYSATPVQNGGQYYVVGDQPATPTGQMLTPLTPAQREKLLNQKPGYQPSGKPNSTPQGN